MRGFPVLVLVSAGLMTLGCERPMTSNDASPPAVSSSELPEQTEPSTTEAETAVVDNSEVKETATPDWRQEVLVSLKSWDETRDTIAAYRGRVVVVDVWSTACEPCLREFPNLVALQQQFPDDVVCLSLNCDYAGVRRKPPEYYRERVEKVLNAQDAKIINVMCNLPADELFQLLKIDSIPAAFVYDREGKLVQTFDNNTNPNAEFTYAADVVPAVQKLVEAKADSNSESASLP